VAERGMGTCEIGGGFELPVLCKVISNLKGKRVRYSTGTVVWVGVVGREETRRGEGARNSLNPGFG
jgi:hypothetical protein